MSAAEKLERLAVANNRDADHWDRVTASARIREVLPEIIAVVKAAERREDFAAPGVARLVADLDEALK